MMYVLRKCNPRPLCGMHRTGRSNRWVFDQRPSPPLFVKDTTKYGAHKSYTTKLAFAKRFHSEEAAKADSCPGNEYPVPLIDLVHYKEQQRGN